MNPELIILTGVSAVNVNTTNDNEKLREYTNRTKESFSNILPYFEKVTSDYAHRKAYIASAPDEEGKMAVVGIFLAAIEHPEDRMSDTLIVGIPISNENILTVVSGKEQSHIDRSEEGWENRLETILERAANDPAIYLSKEYFDLTIPDTHHPPTIRGQNFSLTIE